MPQPVLKNPFVIDWKQSSKENSSIITNSLKDILGPLRKNTKKPKKKNSKVIETDDNNQISNKILLPEVKSNFVFGISQVIKGLERKNLLCAIFDRISLKSSPISYQIGSLCVNSEAHCGCLDNLNEMLSPVLKVNSLMALGIKITASDNETLFGIVQIIKTNLNPVVMKSAAAVESNKNDEYDQQLYKMPLVVLPEANSTKRKKNKEKSKNKKTKKLKK